MDNERGREETEMITSRHFGKDGIPKESFGGKQWKESVTLSATENFDFIIPCNKFDRQSEERAIKHPNFVGRCTRVSASAFLP